MIILAVFVLATDDVSYIFLHLSYCANLGNPLKQFIVTIYNSTESFLRHSTTFEGISSHPHRLI